MFVFELIRKGMKRVSLPLKYRQTYAVLVGLMSEKEHANEAGIVAPRGPDTQFAVEISHTGLFFSR